MHVDPYIGCQHDYTSCLHIPLTRLGFFLQGTNALFGYQKAASAAGVPFDINPSSGILTVSGPLDYETIRSYTFAVSYRQVLSVCVGGREGKR